MGVHCVSGSSMRADREGCRAIASKFLIYQNL